MPKKLTRLWLEVVSVKVERLQDITREDAKAEGVCGLVEGPHRSVHHRASPFIHSFANLWDSINAKPREVRVHGEIVSYVAYPWDASHSICRETEWRGKPLLVCPNPWVWVIEFKRAEDA